MKTTAESYPTHLVREALYHYGYRENHQTEDILHLRHHRSGKVVSIPTNQPSISRQQLGEIIGQGPMYYDIVWNLGK